LARFPIIAKLKNIKEKVLQKAMDYILAGFKVSLGALEQRGGVPSNILVASCKHFSIYIQI